MDIRPVDLPELRHAILNYYSKPDRTAGWEEAITRGKYAWLDGTLTPPLRPGSGAAMQRRECGRVANADLYYVAPDMVDLVLAASQSVPDFTIEEFDVPSRSGFMVFGKPIDSGVTYPEGETPEGVMCKAAPILHSAICWDFIASSTPTLWLSFYADREYAFSLIEPRPTTTRLPRLLYGFGSDGVWVTRMSSEERPPSESPMERIGPVLRTTWLLMQQQLASVSQVGIDRAARKRLARVGGDPAPVRVIRLRRVSHGDTTPGASDREYHHQWIVRGHWRQQWYPSREVHRPVWIAPHIKGPEGAPLIGGEKVYAWTK